MKNRKIDFYIDGYYHLCNKSIAGYNIFSYYENVERFLILIEYCNNDQDPIPYSTYNKRQQRFDPLGLINRKDDQLVTIIAFCIMPDHYHLLIKSKTSAKKFYLFISRFENAYTRYFNLKINRKGPLWQSRFRAVEIFSDEQLLYVSKYIHRNPVKKGLAEKAENWEYSSCKDYYEQNILSSIKEISIKNSVKYKKFIENSKEYRKEMRRIQDLLIDK